MSIFRDEFQSSSQRESWDYLGSEGYAPLGISDDPGAVPLAVVAQGPTRVEIIVQFNPGVAGEAQRAALNAVGAGKSTLIASTERGDLMVVEVPQGVAANAVMKALANNPNVSFTEANSAINAQGSNDPNYTGSKMWGMYGDQTTPANQFGSQSGEAWAAGHTGSMKTVIGVIDSGIDYTHPDLYLNIWLNPGEIPTNLGLVDTDGDTLITFRDLNHSSNAKAVSDNNGNGYIDAGDLLNDTRWENGVDNDKNGRIDDLIGWDFFNNDNDPMDGGGHGTHVAGTIGAMGNNGVGVAGVNWNVQMMALKFLPDSGSGSLSGAVAAISYYTAAAKAYDGTAANYVATNNSWGGTSNSTSLLNAIVDGAKNDVLFIAAAGNGGSDKVADDNDVSPYFPTNYSTKAAAGWEAVVSVTAIASNGSRASWANFGDQTVDLGAPGVGIMSTLPGAKYGNYSGTSMATPHVAGAVGLLAASNEALTGAQIRNLLLSTVTATTSLQGMTVTGGRLNVSALLAAGGGTAVPPPSITEAPPEPPATDGNVITGTDSSNTLIGTSGNDIISGVPANSTTLGRGTIDILTGGAGNDLFVVGDDRGVFYNRGLTNSKGMNDYAVITDFSEGDRIQLAPGEYFLREGGTSAHPGVGIWFDRNGDGQFSAFDELVAVVQGPKTVTMADLVIVGAEAPPPPPPPPPPPAGMIIGTDRNDTLVGTTANEVFIGVPTPSSNLGALNFDTMTGGGGNDLFVLGDARGVFYNRNIATSNGVSDYALITDFSAGDRIQLAPGTYFFRAGNTRLADGTLTSGTLIWFDKNGSGAWDSADEVIANVRGAKIPTMADVVFAGSPGSVSVDAIMPASQAAELAPADALVAIWQAPASANGLFSADNLPTAPSLHHMSGMIDLMIA